MAKYDRGPEVPTNDKHRTSPSGRTFWSPQMLKSLQETREIAKSITIRSNREISLTKAWKDEWKKAYPDLNLDWRTVLSRYHYHFGNLDSITEAPNEPKEIKEPTPTKEPFESGGGKVKGFRNWTQAMEIDLIETKAIVVKADPSLEKGSSEFNRALLKEFGKLYPKCMESARSLYSKLQSVEKEQNAIATPNSTPRATPSRSDSVEYTPKSFATPSRSDSVEYTPKSIATPSRSDSVEHTPKSIVEGKAPEKEGVYFILIGNFSKILFMKSYFKRFQT